MTIQEYVAELEKLKNILPEEVDKILLKKQGIILGMLKHRLYNFGTDGNYDSLGPYSKSTEARKKKEGKKSGFVTLRDTDSFYAGMFLKSKKGEYEIDSTDWKTGLLEDIYGEAILELTFKQQSDIIENIIEPELQKLFDELGGQVEITL
jgi:hypothetical protein